jgi:hypothetical protein
MTKQYIIDRLAEPATWRGIVAILTASGVGIAPEAQNGIITIGLAVAGLIGVVAKG